VQQTLERYRRRIRTGEISPLLRWDGQTSGLIFDPQRDDVPLTMLGFGACRLDSGPHRIETQEREFALVPVAGRFEVRVGPAVFRGRREEGPFVTLPGESSAYAIYAPAGATVELSGTGEVVYFTAPAAGHKPPAMVKPGERPNLARGTGIWLRQVVTLFTPDDVSTVLVGGETYSPPGLWSGTPLHIHDVDDPEHGQSDHEEVYYHLARFREGKWGPFGVQMLFDDQGLDNAYVIHDRDAFAIPGAAHPVIAGPNSDMLYVWGLAGTAPALRMLDVPEFAYLKKVGEILDAVTSARPRQPLSSGEFARLAASNGLTSEQGHVLRMHLKQQGIEIR
jgi:5-deoxy-glucuronate isomerase